MSKELTAVSLFTGAGGMDAGFERAGINSVIIPDSVTDIGLWVFPENCKVLRN